MKRTFNLILALTLLTSLILSSCSDKIDVSKVTYTNPTSDEFLKNWYILGPIAVSGEATPSEDMQKKAFDSDFFTSDNLTQEMLLQSQTINGKQYNWQLHESQENIVDLSSIFGDTNYVYAYAFAEINSKKATQLLVGLGSDDGVKVWLNGKEIHKNYYGRPVIVDEDLFKLDLQKGRNTLILKVQDMAGDWGFCLRPIGANTISHKLYEEAGRGNIDNIIQLLTYNPDINYTAPEGLSVIQNAMVKGRTEVVELLAEKGAEKSSNLPAIGEYIDLGIKSNIDGETPAFAVLVSQNGEVIYKNAYGYANMDTKTLATTTTKFRIGSITKQFIASAILKLQELNKLSVDDKLTKFISDYPRGDEVTIHHLLTHTSGIQSYTDRSGFLDKVVEPMEASVLVDSMKTWEFNFNPGEEFRYNNSGYYLLAEIIEIVSGQWYGDYLDSAFFTPLNMENTGVYQNDSPPANEAIGYTIEEEEIQPALNWEMTWAGGAGSLYSTVEDLNLWNEALFNGKVLTKKSLTSAHTVVTLNDGSVPDMMKYGYGWGVNIMRGATEIAHGGGLHGFISYLIRYPEHNITIVTLTNTTPTMNHLEPSQKAIEIAEYILWDKLEPQESYRTINNIDPETLSDYVGRYDYGNAMILVVTIENNKLYAQMSGQPKFELFPSEKDKFFWKVVEAQIVFKRDVNGAVTHGVHSQGGDEMKVPKLPELKTIAISKEDITPYLGKYKFDEGFYLEITLNDNNQLFIQATGQDKFEVFKVSDDTYEPKTINISMRFYTNNGIATMDYTQGPIQKTLTKE